MPKHTIPPLLLLSSVILVFVNGGLALAAAETVSSNSEKNGYGNIGVYELTKGNMSMKLTNWGATIMSILLPDKHG